MNLRNGSKITLLNLLSTLYAVTYGSADNWLFSHAVELDASDPSGKNSKIKITALTAAPYSGKRTFKYDRLDLSILATMCPPQLSRALTGANSVHDTFDYLLKCTGILFGPDDLEDLPLTSLGDGKFTIPLVAKAGTSIFWKGSVTLTSGDLPYLGDAIATNIYTWG